VSGLAAPDPVLAALRTAWSGADPGATDHSSRPPDGALQGPATPLPRHPESGLGGLLDLALAGDPTRLVGGVRLRRVPSAGGRYPVDALLVGEGWARRYDPIAHALAGPDPVPDGPAAVRLCLVPARTVWRYGPRSLPVLLLDLGHAVAALLAAAAALGSAAQALLGPGPAVSAPRADPPLVEAAIDALAACSAPDRIGPPAPHPPEVLLARRSASWAAITSGAGDPRVEHLAGVARRALGPGQHAVLLPRSDALLTALARRACGQPALAGAGALLVVTGDEQPDAAAVLSQHVRAGVAVHEAWLAATAAEIPARPVGCWIDAVLDGPTGRARVLHALALGVARAR
jgi:hypothetical protein